MTTLTIPDVFYPESDGIPMADNALQFRWMSLLRWNAEALLCHDRYVLISADHLIYPVRGNALIRIAPDVYIAYGPEKGDRGSYRVWEEGNVFPQVIFEVYSPSNTHAEMQHKREFCALYRSTEARAEHIGRRLTHSSCRVTVRAGGGRRYQVARVRIAQRGAAFRRGAGLRACRAPRITGAARGAQDGCGEPVASRCTHARASAPGRASSYAF